MIGCRLMNLSKTLIYGKITLYNEYIGAIFAPAFKKA